MYRIGIWLIALALVLNGVTAYSWNILPAVSAVMAQDHRDAADASACKVTSDDDIAAAADAGQTHHIRHNHLKCCWTCNVASLLPNATAVFFTFSDKAAVFHTAHHDLAGHLVALDPDIPKSVV